LPTCPGRIGWPRPDRAPAGQAQPRRRLLRPLGATSLPTARSRPNASWRASTTSAPSSWLLRHAPDP